MPTLRRDGRLIQLFCALLLTLFNKNNISQIKVANMKCNSCKLDLLITDFINNQKFCYHCIYRIKLEKSGQKRTRKSHFCRNCGKEVIQKENLKKRQRTVFCSSECAGWGHKKQVNNHWTRKIRTQNSWKGKGKGLWNINPT
jgi:hypothetical protein